MVSKEHLRDIHHVLDASSRRAPIQGLRDKKMHYLT